MADGIDCTSLKQYQEYEETRVFGCATHGRTTLEACQSCEEHRTFPTYPDFEIAGVIQTTPHRQQYFKQAFRSLLHVCKHVEQEIDSPPSGAFPAFVMALTRLFYRHLNPNRA